MPLRNLIKSFPSNSLFQFLFDSLWLSHGLLHRLSHATLTHDPHTGKRRARHQANTGERKSLAALNAGRAVSTGNSQHQRKLPGRERDWCHTES